MGQYKQITNIITNWCIGNGAINEVTDGDISEVDLSTNTNFPLVHLIYLDNTYLDGYTEFNYQILFLDTYFPNEDDRLEILDAMNEVVTEFVNSIHSGALFANQIRVQTDPTGDVMYDQLQNRLYGWSLNLSVAVPNGLTQCG